MAGLQQAFIEPLVPLYQFHKVNMVCIEALRDEQAAHELQKYLQVNEVGCGTPKDGTFLFTSITTCRTSMRPAGQERQAESKRFQPAKAAKASREVSMPFT
jgi:hypothetical protein